MAMAIFVHLFWFSFLYETSFPARCETRLSHRRIMKMKKPQTKEEDDNEDVDEDEDEAATDAC